MRTKTDVVLNARNCPFVTLTESRITNVWYHEKTDYLFMLTEDGFFAIKGSKKELEDRGLIQNKDAV